ncbi:Glycine rich protein [compost metagenome]
MAAGSGYYGGKVGENSTGGGGGSGYIGGVQNGQTIVGNTSLTAPGGETEIGHTGNGYARITFVNE